jgi:hypothetical protein
MRPVKPLPILCASNILLVTSSASFDSFLAFFIEINIDSAISDTIATGKIILPIISLDCMKIIANRLDVKHTDNIIRIISPAMLSSE